jgi:hypothetical protein
MLSVSSLEPCLSGVVVSWQVSPRPIPRP